MLLSHLPFENKLWSHDSCLLFVMEKDKDRSVSLDDLIIWTNYWKHMQGSASKSNWYNYDSFNSMTHKIEESTIKKLCFFRSTVAIHSYIQANRNIITLERNELEILRKSALRTNKFSQQWVWVNMGAQPVW